MFLLSLLTVKVYADTDWYDWYMIGRNCSPYTWLASCFDVGSSQSSLWLPLSTVLSQHLMSTFAREGPPSCAVRKAFFAPYQLVSVHDVCMWLSGPWVHEAPNVLTLQVHMYWPQFVITIAPTKLMKCSVVRFLPVGCNEWIAREGFTSLRKSGASWGPRGSWGALTTLPSCVLNGNHRELMSVYITSTHALTTHCPQLGSNTLEHHP